MAIEFDDEQITMISMHPALDIVGDTVYLTVRAAVRGQGMQDVIVTSKGDVFSLAEWTIEAQSLGLYPLVDVNLQHISPRWNSRALQELQAKTLQAPSWSDTNSAWVPGAS